ncbi:MAG: hypothetical protein QQN41_13160, partial [Nitrosopumilus sp.]
MRIILISLVIFVFLSIFLAVCIRLYLSNWSMSAGLLSETRHQGAKMLRLQYFLLSLFGAMFYLILILSKGEFPQVPDIFFGLLGLSSVGYLGGKSVHVYRCFHN